MSRRWIWSDLHLGHKGVIRFRPEFSSSEEHHQVIFDKLATAVGKKDTVFLPGDIAFTQEWLDKIAAIRCSKKVLIAGNHCTDGGKGINFKQWVGVYDEVVSLMTYKGFWMSHCPIHPQEMRNRKGNIHGHLHDKVVLDAEGNPDKRYCNVSYEQFPDGPARFEDVQERLLSAV